MKNKKHSRLTLKFVNGFLILGLAIIFVAIIVGYVQFKDSIQRQYNDEAYQIANAAKSIISDDVAKKYGNIAKEYSYCIDETSKEKLNEEINEIIESDEYKELQQLFSYLRESMGANDIYLVYVNLDILNDYQGSKEGWYPFTYILDCYTVSEYSYVLGNQGPINPDFIDETTNIVKTGKRSSNYFASKSDYGYNTTALITLSMGSENLALGVEIPMTTIKSTLRSYLIQTIIATASIVILGIALFVFYIMKRVVLPLNKVSYETSNFIENQNEISQSLSNISTKDEIEDLAKSVLKMQTDLKLYIENLTKVTAEKERIGAELDVARDIQSSMLPCIFPAFPDRKEFNIYASMLAAKEVGGDFYDFFMVDDDHLAIVIADVSGKGVPAALFMVIGKTLIKDHTSPNRNLGEVFSEVNNLLCEADSEGLFITAFEGVIDLRNGEFRYVNAGHEMPIVARNSLNFESVKVKSAFVLAGLENFKYKEEVTYLKPGDRIFLYTDGVPEATNANNELFGMERTLKSINSHKELKANDLLPAIKKDVDEFVSGAPQFDDITMLCLEFNAYKNN